MDKVHIQHAIVHVEERDIVKLLPQDQEKTQSRGQIASFESKSYNQPDLG